MYRQVHDRRVYRHVCIHVYTHVYGHVAYLTADITVARVALPLKICLDATDHSQSPAGYTDVRTHGDTHFRTHAYTYYV